MKTNVTVAGMAALTPLELLDAHVSNRLPAHITVRALLTMVHEKLRTEETNRTLVAAFEADVASGEHFVDGNSIEYAMPGIGAGRKSE